MERLEINNKLGYIYNLVDENDKKYDINLEILDIDEQPKIGDFIYMNKELLNPKYDGYSTSYTFGSFDNKYGKENVTLDDIDVIKYICDDKEIYLKRLYG